MSNRNFKLGLSDWEKVELIEYLKSLVLGIIVHR